MAPNNHLSNPLTLICSPPTLRASNDSYGATFSSPMPARPDPATLMLSPGTPATPAEGFIAPPSLRSGLHGGEWALWYLRPLRFLYRFPQISHRYGFSFSIPSVPGYGTDVSGLTIENVPSAFSCSCWLVWPC